MIVLKTERLRLRCWTDDDRPAFHALNSDPAVMATIGPTQSQAESDAFLDLIAERYDRDGFGLWCVDLDGEALGFTGLFRPDWRDGVEIGWRIRSEHWGNGYAPEAAAAVLHHGFGLLGLAEVISFTAAANTKSRRVMEKIGLEYDPAEDFDHPSVPAASPLRPHVLYRLAAEAYVAPGLRAGAGDLPTRAFAWRRSRRR